MRAPVPHNLLDAERIEQMRFWAYRFGAFIVLNVLDDPAWLALIFC